ncbi:MAG TPA: hypothetical protein VGN00_22630 [Puia sp.]|jgi:hypothetical protein
MKRTIAAILAFLYLGMSTGATVHFHYCMGKLMSWALVDNERSDCSYCGMPKAAGSGHCVVAKKGCCQDEVKKLQVDKDQRMAESSFPFLDHSFMADLPFFREVSGNWPVSFIVDYPIAHGPPDRGKVPVFVRCCNFRI